MGVISLEIRNNNELNESANKMVGEFSNLITNCESIYYVINSIEEAWISDYPDKKEAIKAMKEYVECIKRYVEVSKNFTSALNHYSITNAEIGSKAAR